MAVFERRGSRIFLRVRLTPRAGQDAVAGRVMQADGREALGVRVRAIPEKGRANGALVSVLAKRLRVPKRTVTVVSGYKSRAKTIQIDAADRALEDALNALAGVGTDRGTRDERIGRPD